MAKQYNSELLAAVHESAEALHRAGSIDKRTMKKFEDACLEPVKIFLPKKYVFYENVKDFHSLFLPGTLTSRKVLFPRGSEGRKNQVDQLYACWLS